MQWFVGKNGQQQGPMDIAAARAYAQANPEAYCWRQGFAEWLRISQVAELEPLSPPIPASSPLMAERSGSWAAAAQGQLERGNAQKPADALDYRIHGTEMQFVEIELVPGESVAAAADSLMFKDAAIAWPKTADNAQALASGLASRLAVFRHDGQARAKIAFTASFPGVILPILLSRTGGRLVCHKSGFLAATGQVAIDLAGGEDVRLYRLEGAGWVFIQVGGSLMERDLSAGETLHVNIDRIAAMTNGRPCDDNGAFFVSATGPGKVWMHGLPFYPPTGPRRDGNRR